MAIHTFEDAMTQFDALVQDLDANIQREVLREVAARARVILANHADESDEDDDLDDDDDWVEAARLSALAEDEDEDGDADADDPKGHPS